MGFFSKLLGIRDTEEAMESLESAISLLRMSVFSCLLKKVYTSKFSSDEAPLWAMAVLNTMMLLPPGNEQAKIFYEKYEDQIWQETLQVKKYPVLSGGSGGASHLYFAQIFFDTAMYNKPQIGQAQKNIYGSKIMELEERAKQLGIFIPKPKDVCNSNNPLDIIDYICSYANEFVKKSIAG